MGQDRLLFDAPGFRAGQVSLSEDGDDLIVSWRSTTVVLLGVEGDTSLDSLLF